MKLYNVNGSILALSEEDFSTPGQRGWLNAHIYESATIDKILDAKLDAYLIRKGYKKLPTRRALLKRRFRKACWDHPWLCTQLYRCYKLRSIYRNVRSYVGSK